MSDPFEENAYLMPTFDPLLLRVAELRRIFFEHNIDFKSTAKKAELVQIFNEEVRPQAASLLRAKLNPVPSANKIETVGLASPVALPSTTPAKTPGKRGRQKKHALLTDDELAEAVIPPSTGKKTTGRPRKVPKTESIDEPTTTTLKSSTRSPVRKSPKKATIKSSPKDEIMEDDVVDTPAPKLKLLPKPSTGKRLPSDPTFSSDNPFQSGSPPSPNKRRQTVVPNSSQKLAPPLAKTDRRKTDGVIQSLSSKAGSTDVEFTFSKGPKTPQAASPFRKNERFMPAVSQLKASPAFQSAAQRSKENILATKQLLAKHEQDGSLTEDEIAVEGPATTRARVIRKHKGPGRLAQLLKMGSLLGLTAGSAYGANWYRNEKIKAGYCGLDSDPVVTRPHESGLVDLAALLKPHCVPCPPHAICSPGFQMRCEDEFQKVTPPIALGGLVPVSGYCAPDTEKLRRIRIVADEIVETLRDRTASVECSYPSVPEGEHIGMTATELKDKLLAKKAPAISTEQFDTLFDHAIEEVRSRNEIEISSSKPSVVARHHRVDPIDGSIHELADVHVEDYYHSTSLANISIVCSIRRTFFTVLARYRLELIGLLTLLGLSLYLKNYFQSRNLQRIKVQALVARVYDELARTKAKAVDNPARYEPHLGVSQLRDSILADEFSYYSRERLWMEVQAIVEGNSNVRATQAEIQGEWLRAWEWVGAVREVTLADKRREMGLEDGDEFVRPVV